MPTCRRHGLTLTGEFCSQVSGPHRGRDSGWEHNSHVRTAGHPNELTLAGEFWEIEAVQ